VVFQQNKDYDNFLPVCSSTSLTLAVVFQQNKDYDSEVASEAFASVAVSQWSSSKTRITTIVKIDKATKTYTRSGLPAKQGLRHVIELVTDTSEHSLAVVFQQNKDYDNSKAIPFSTPKPSWSGLPAKQGLPHSTR
jgi:hypothetical protein